MKKFLKTFLICFCLVPCVFLLGACGKKDKDNPNQVKVNTKGQYVATSAGEVQQLLTDAKTEENDIEKTYNSVRLSMVTEVKGDDATLKNEVHATIVNTETMQLKFQSIALGQTTDLYVYQGNAYLSVAGLKTSAPVGSGVIDVMSMISVLPTLSTFEEQINNYVELTGAVIEKSVQGDVTKIHVSTQDAQLDSSNDVWFIFDGQLITGIKTISKLANQTTTIDAEVGNDFQIAFPDFSEWGDE